MQRVVSQSVGESTFQVDDLQGSSPQLPFVPVVVDVDEGLHEVRRGACAHILCQRQA